MIALVRTVYHLKMSLDVAVTGCLLLACITERLRQCD